LRFIEKIIIFPEWLQFEFFFAGHPVSADCFLLRWTQMFED